MYQVPVQQPWRCHDSRFFKGVSFRNCKCSSFFMKSYKYVMFTSKPFKFQSGETAIKITPSVYLIDVPITYQIGAPRTNHNRAFCYRYDYYYYYYYYCYYYYYYYYYYIQTLNKETCVLSFQLRSMNLIKTNNCGCHGNIKFLLDKFQGNSQIL